ncbi:ATP-binding protein [Alkaliphilus peptidifermentans]|uniref:Anti-sigma regulatory factor (Ser/Thr protein kinase) n=1 Tax=Alkaliphilus peptidifermentans DSM 18978 TaxID=1120976 RepID=A0A1G5DP72_9FIRM|nr:anti-sigma regulatory factor [Alkaliphilus peptidifermentans]SCY16475.1 Anti-sigma regulatory factor (Ser/Thr protein kinase) [Alkaliphilus peptidifermentans DSM 18978]
MSNIQLCYNIERQDFSKAGEASSNIKKALRQLGINSGTIRRVAVATYEAEMNIIIHSEGGIIGVTVDVDKIRIDAKDTGPGIEDIDMAMKEGYSTATPEIRELGFGAGMGLPNMKRYADEFKIESSVGNPTIITIVIYL